MLQTHHTAMASNEGGKNITELPVELILKVFDYLGHADRQEAAATCKCFYAALCLPAMNTNVMAHFVAINVCDNAAVVRCFNKSSRPVNTFLFERTSLGDAKEFLQKISTMARSVILREIEMCDNEVRSFIKELKVLESLTLDSCSNLFKRNFDETDKDIEYANALANIKVLKLKNNMNAQLCRTISSIRALKSFDIDDFGVDMMFANANECSNGLNVFDLNKLVPHLPHLRELNFRHVRISQSFERLVDMSSGRLNLRRLGLGTCVDFETKFGSYFYNFITRQQMLVSLDLKRTGVDDKGLKILIDNLPLLQDLNIAGNEAIRDDGAVSLGKLKSLKKLNLGYLQGIEGVAITDGIAAQENTTLCELSLYQTRLSTAAINAVAKNLQSLHTLNLTYCANVIEDQTVQTIIEYLTQLSELCLSGCFTITDRALTGAEFIFEDDVLVECLREGYSIENLRNLKNLSLSECTRITDLSLHYGIKGKQLRSLSLSQCYKITSSGINSLVQNAPRLEHVNLSHCGGIDDEAVHAMAITLKRLKSLNLDGCEHITDRAMSSIKDNCKCLQTLSVYGCAALYVETTICEALKHLKHKVRNYKYFLHESY